MKNAVYLVLLVIAVAVVINKGGSDFAGPAEASVRGNDVEEIVTYEYLDLFRDGIPTSKLAVRGHYTVVEGYTNRCGICKVLESKFDPFLDQRKDVVIRKVHFPESGFSFSFRSAEEMADHFERMALYRFNHVEKKSDSYDMATCGTPHVEIYGPDKMLIAGDYCKEKSKVGLDFLNEWLAAEI